MSTYNLTYKPFGNHAILIEWSSKIDENTLKDVVFYKNKIYKNNIKVIVDIINTYSSLTIIYKYTIKNIYDEILTLKLIYKNPLVQSEVKNYCWKIPVCYDLKFGLDLKEISSKKEMDIDSIISMHSTVIYTVYFIGFLPGFLYLGGLDKKLNFDRKPNPRLVVEKGSVGIGGVQTGIYPQNSAGGWTIIGKSPISFFDITKKEPCFSKSGDKIKFIPISLDEYQQIDTQIKIGSYQLEKELLND
ncbi:MAG: 5-oxoprolinase subunit PxpB [Flavobacteriaceae bacterium]|nr:5-oxoprolinase subunit PxpB [Flavobacteriaceae bacterium]